MDRNNKRIIIINGKGGSGKDTAVQFVNDYYTGSIMNVSTIDPIKKVASLIGWKGSKNDIDRKFLSDLKSLSTEYNDYPTQYIYNQIDRFNRLGVYCMRFMFIHCREPENIKKITSYLDTLNTKYYTLLIKRNSIDKNKHGNDSDDNVDNYGYDFVYNNSYEDLDIYRESFMKFFNKYIVGE